MKKKMIIVLFILVCLVSAFICFNPKLRVNVFVALHSNQVEQAYQTGDFPEAIGGRKYTFRKGGHPMIEFTLSAWGLVPSTAYYGCYYSPDDVPLSFQRAGETLVPQENDSWVWYGEGDNHGMTYKIKDHWYYFDAHF